MISFGSTTVTAAVETAETNTIESASLSTFNDIGEDDSNAMYIKYLVNQNIMSGYPDGSFHPGEGLTRAQAAAVMVRVAGISPSELGGKMFPDV